jgi:hypothetical protein
VESQCGGGGDVEMEAEVEGNNSSESFSCEEACTRTMLGNPEFFHSISRFLDVTVIAVMKSWRDLPS